MVKLRNHIGRSSIGREKLANYRSLLDNFPAACNTAIPTVAAPPDELPTIAELHPIYAMK
jgi:hypothetical protein